MPRSLRSSTVARSAVFAPLDGIGRAELVERRLADAIALGVLADGERLPRESDLARFFGVATVTAREALEALRDRGLLRTTRGRDGGSFVTADRPDDRLLDSRVRGLSRVELRDMAVYYAAINAGAAELAADRSSADDVEQLRLVLTRTDLADQASTRRSEGVFHLELAALSQSARLVREEVRLQAECGSLLWLCMRSDAARCRCGTEHAAIVDAIASMDGPRARVLTAAHIAANLEWLIDHKVALESASGTEPEEPPS